MDILSYFERALDADTKPALLEFTHPRRKTRFSVCGINPVATLEVRNDRLFHNGVHVGCALDIFDYLRPPHDTNFFPAYLGFFSYEFSEYFGKATSAGERPFPDAFFRLYHEGLIVDDDRVIHHDAIPERGREHLHFLSQTLKPSLSQSEFFQMVNEVKERIRLGNVYQVNVSLPFYFDASDSDMLAIYRAMRAHNHSPFMGVMHHDDWWVLSGSPERLFFNVDNEVSTRPIAGTKRREFDRGKDDEHVEELKRCPKENAEHAMLVDLMRNDLNQIAHPGSVHVQEDRSVEFYSHVMHLVSEVNATTSSSLLDIFRAIFPGGTITGAPKASVMQTIADLELQPRGPYTGSMGYVSSGCGTDFNILIRSVYKHGEKTWISAGAGIVIDSVAEQEWAEVHKKAQAIKDILGNKSIAKPTRPTLYGPRIPFLENAPDLSRTHVLFLENSDSFSFNIIDALRSLSASVYINTPPADVDITHIVIGPGPGNPESLPAISALIDYGISRGLPTLGICLGHQAIGHYFGARVVKIGMPVHGKSQLIHHFGRGLFFGLTSPCMFTRYHSLALDKAPADFLVDAYTDDDCIMAISHNRLPIFGIQFHPESYLSQNGFHLLQRFLKCGPYDVK